MRYWQITTRRLSRAASKLTMDDVWHEWNAAPHSWYRVRNKKMVQRVTFDSPQEAEVLLPLVHSLEPLPELAQASGFREEITVRLLDDSLWFVIPLGYAFKEPAI